MPARPNGLCVDMQRAAPYGSRPCFQAGAYLGDVARGAVALADDQAVLRRVLGILLVTLGVGHRDTPVGVVDDVLAEERDVRALLAEVRLRCAGDDGRSRALARRTGGRRSS